MNKIAKINIDYSSVPLSNYPRPLLERNLYLSLNGEWQYSIINQKEKGKQIEFLGSVMVPYAIETPLSGVNHLLNADEILIYRKKVLVPEEFNNKRVILHFDGVDQICDVYVNNKKVGNHIGGYTRFSFDVTDEINENRELEISVVCVDKSDLSALSTGKQKLKRGGIFYTTTSGIWKPVWLEAVSQRHIKNVRFTPLFDEKCVRIFIETNVPGPCKVKINNQEFLMDSNQETLVKLEDFLPWSPSEPNLYCVYIEFFEDIVKSYFGLRKVEIKEDKNGLKRLFLNNEPLFIKGVLDQGYYFLGNLTPEKFEDYLFDIKSLKELGYNTIRKHIKTENDLFYYYCDKEGMLVIQDFINGGKDYKKEATTIPGIRNRNYYPKESNLKIFGREDVDAQKLWIRESATIQQELYNHPSLIMYTIFNEGWGQFLTKENYTYFKQNDPTRLYDTTSGWIDYGNSDFLSVHNYFFKHKIYKDKYNLKRPQFLSEYGGYGLLLKDHYFGRKKFGYKNFKNSASLTKAFTKLHEKQILPLIKNGLMGTIYTQVSDVEDEVNGLFTFDRKVLKIDKEKLIEINNKIDEEFKNVI